MSEKEKQELKEKETLEKLSDPRLVNLIEKMNQEQFESYLTASSILFAGIEIGSGGKK